MKKVPTGPTLPPSAVSNPGWILSGSPVDVPKPKGSDLTSGAGGSGSEGSVSPSPARRGGTGWIEAGVGGRPRRGRDRRGTMHRDGKVFAVARRSAVGTARGETRSRRRRGRGRVSGRTGTADDGGAAARGEGDARGTGGGDDARGGERDAARRCARHDARRGKSDHDGRRRRHRREFEPRRGGDGSGSGTESAPCCWRGLDRETVRDTMARRARPRATSPVSVLIFFAIPGAFPRRGACHVGVEGANGADAQRATVSANAAIRTRTRDRRVKVGEITVCQSVREWCLQKRQNLVRSRMPLQGFSGRSRSL